MSVVNGSGGGRSPRRRGFSFRALPLWAQWVLPFAVAGAIVLGVVLFVQYETTQTPALANYNSAAAVAEQNREDTILVGQQQAPHRARLKPGEAAAAGLRAAVVGYMSRQINTGSMDGPIERSSCRAAAGSGGARLVFRCRVTASAQMVTYPFDGVVQTRSGVITYCQRVTPPVPSLNVPVSRRCT
ncbi:MAG TPA: hypothetical protein VFN36_04705 [Solirubrobacteraceae bacterium]|nr:hypothetical protein [Solirubrobacteraceae bacterium]